MRKNCTYLLWGVIVCAAIQAACKEMPIAYVLDEISTALVFLIIALLHRSIISWLVFALAVGKIYDGYISPYSFGINERLWIVMCASVAFCVFIYKRLKSKNNE